MSNLINRARLFVSTCLIWVASRIAPEPMGILFLAYCEMLDGFTEQVRLGRTFGVIGAPWWTVRDHAQHALAMQQAAMEALAETRAAIAMESPTHEH